jgi:V/A-type H+/Na+-transporting ATPase subunit E
MDQKLKELTEKLYQEGVAKGNNQAGQIIEEANQKAKQIIADAENKAMALVAEAEKKAIEMDKNSKSELKLASRQLISALEQEVTDLINGQIVGTAVKSATDDQAFIQKLILEAVANWAPKQDLLVVVSPENKKAVDDFFATKAKKMLDQGVEIQSVNNIKTGFQIGPVDGSYKVSFTSEDFIEFFKAFIRPKVVELLFDRK